MLTTPSPVKAITSRLGTRAKLVLSAHPYASVAALLADCHSAAVDQLMAQAGGPAWDEPSWERLHAAVRSGVAAATGAIVGQVEEIVAGAADVLAVLAQAGAGGRCRSACRRARPARGSGRRRAS